MIFASVCIAPSAASTPLGPARIRRKPVRVPLPGASGGRECLGLLKILLAVIFLLCRELPLNAQALQFTLLPGEGTTPSARFDGPIAYDSQSQQIFLFGGQADRAQNDLWSYSLASRRWTPLAANGAPPPARFGHTLVLDSKRRRLVAFGGQAGGFFNDVWAFDLQQQSWLQLSSGSAGPSRRYGHSAILDPVRDRMVISHGFTDSGRFDDTWAFDLARNTWADISPPTGRPLRRCLHHAVYDPASDAMFLYAGCSSGFGPCPQNDLWSFDLRQGRWTLLDAAPPLPGRERYGLGFDPSRRRLLVFGGGGTLGFLNDTWEYLPANRQWRKSDVTGTAPAPRSRHEAAAADELGAVFFFGGSTNTGVTNELWMLGPAPSNVAPAFSSAALANAFSSAAGPFAPGAIVSLYGTDLGPAVGVTAQADQQLRRLPTSLAGTSVTWQGIAAPLYFVQADQINMQVPYELAGAAAAEIVVTYRGVAGTPVGVNLVPTQPGLLPQLFHADGAPIAPDRPARAGEIVVLYATGQGITNPPSLTGALATAPYPSPSAASVLRIGGVATELLFLGQAPGTAGVLQINVRIPAGLTSGAASVELGIGGGVSQPGVTVWIE